MQKYAQVEELQFDWLLGFINLSHLHTLDFRYIVIKALKSLIANCKCNFVHSSSEPVDDIMTATWVANSMQWCNEGQTSEGDITAQKTKAI